MIGGSAPTKEEFTMKKYVCPVCGYVHEGDAPPEQCPQCKVSGDKFVEQAETKTYVCPVCGYVHEGTEPPEKCPQCGVPGEKFIEKTDNGKLEFACEHVLGERSYARCRISGVNKSAGHAAANAIPVALSFLLSYIRV